VPAPHVCETSASRESRVAARQPERFGVEAFGNTHRGLVRPGNEDSFAVLHHLGLFVVADGMGGHAAGEVASRLTVDCVREAVEATRPSGRERPGRAPNTHLLVAGIQRAHGRIAEIARRDATKKGMGTTVAGLLVVEDRVLIAHVGDSRVYRLRGRQLVQLTEDHSLLNAFIQAGRWDPSKADAFPQPHVITRAVGVIDPDEDFQVDSRLDAPLPGDVYLICSDGLTNMLDHTSLASILLKYPDVTQATTRLIEAANERGGTDNITAVLVRWVGAHD